jgi:release factor glutamine methyltransferase
MPEARGVTIRELWAQTAEVIGARNEARWLCEVATALDGDDFVVALDEPVTERMVAHLDAMVARYRAGEPLQYVLGRWGFRRLDLAIDARVLIPRPETELVAEAAIEIAAALDPPRLVADLGTGSGAIGLSLAAELPLAGTTVWMTDKDEDALAVARSNLAGIGRAARNVRIAAGSWFDALPNGERFDVIVSNPPYVAEGSRQLDESVAKWEPADALLAGAGGLDAIRAIVGGASEHLTDGGWLVLEIGADQGEAVRQLFERAGLEQVQIRQDHAGRDRIALGRRPV